MFDLHLKRLANDRVKGIYTVAGVPGKMPDRLRAMSPEAAESFESELSEVVVVSDMIRTAEQSLTAIKTRQGSQPPGYSGHNFGFSADAALKETMKNLGVKTKRDLDVWMEKRGWYCHRRDHAMVLEAWHYNYLGVGFKVTETDRSTNPALQAKIMREYGAHLSPDDTMCQRLLGSLKLYHGEIDGIIGPRSREAVKAFQRTWNLKQDGLLNDRTRRTLSFVTATVLWH